MAEAWIAWGVVFLLVLAICAFVADFKKPTVREDDQAQAHPSEKGLW